MRLYSCLRIWLSLGFLVWFLGRLGAIPFETQVLWIDEDLYSELQFRLGPISTLSNLEFRAWTRTQDAADTSAPGPFAALAETDIAATTDWLRVGPVEMPPELRQLLVPIGFSLSNTGPPAFPGLPPVAALSGEPYGIFLRTPGSWDFPLRAHGYAFAFAEEVKLALTAQASFEPAHGVEVVPSVWAAGSPGIPGGTESVLGAAVRMRSALFGHLGVDLWGGASWDIDNHAAWGFLGIDLKLDASLYEVRRLKAMYQFAQNGARGIAEEVPDMPSILGLGYGDRIRGEFLTQETEVLVSVDTIHGRADEVSALWRIGAEPAELSARLRHDLVQEKGRIQLGISIGNFSTSAGLKLEGSVGYEQERIVSEAIRAEFGASFATANSRLSFQPQFSIAIQRPGPKITDYLSSLGHVGDWKVSGTLQFGALAVSELAELELSIGLGIDEPIDPIILNGIAVSEVLSGKASQLVDFILVWAVRSRDDT